VEIVVKRKGATPTPDGANGIKPAILIVKEFVTPGRTPSPVPMTEGTVTLRPGVVYALYTGLAIKGVTRPWQLYAEALPAAAKAGLQVVRVGADPEIVVYVTTFETMQLTLREEAVFCEVLNTQFSLNSTTVTVEAGAQLAPVGFVPAVAANERVVKDLSAEQNRNAGAPAKELSPQEQAAKVDEWLNADDGKGKVVSADTTTLAAPVLDFGTAAGRGSSAAFTG
jgi:hypothetical protein